VVTASQRLPLAPLQSAPPWLQNLYFNGKYSPVNRNYCICSHFDTNKYI
jgi:hypothetical protein